MKIIKTPLKISNLILEFEKPGLFQHELLKKKSLILDIEEFLTKIFTYYAKIDYKVSAMFEVIILESLQYPRQFTEAIAECLFT